MEIRWRAVGEPGVRVVNGRPEGARGGRRWREDGSRREPFESRWKESSSSGRTSSCRIRTIRTIKTEKKSR